MGMGKLKSERENDVVLEKIFEKLKIDFTQTHKMNVPNVEASYNATTRFRQPKPNFDRQIFERAWLRTEEILFPFWKNSKVHTHDEIFRMPDIEFKGKSTGSPWTEAGIPFKLEMYQNQECIDWLESQWDQCFDSLPCLAKVNVKKEILPLKKLALNRLRNVTAVDGAHNMWNQRLCYSLHHNLQKHYIKNLTALGWSPYFLGMHFLAMHLGRFGQTANGWEFDGGAWEAHMFTECCQKIAEMKFRALRKEDQTPENRRRLMNIYQMIACSPLVMPDGHSFLKGDDGYGGNLTGQVGTAHDNTILMIFALNYAWLKLVKAPYDSLHTMLNNLAPIMLGDDCTFTVHPDFLGEFNGKTFAQVLWEDLGFVMETPSWEARSFDKLGFLSMHFHHNEEKNFWVHEVDRDKLYSSLLQGGTNRTPEEQMQRICNMRNVSWGNVQVRKEMQAIIDEYQWVYSHMDGQPAWEDAKKSYVTDLSLGKLYYGLESMTEGESQRVIQNFIQYAHAA